MVLKWMANSPVVMVIDAHWPEAAECLYTREELERALDRLSREIGDRLTGPEPLLVLTVMHGALVTAGHLLPRLSMPLETDYVHASRYGHRMEGDDQLRWLHRPATPLAGRRILIVDDILDRGLTLKGLVEACRGQGALSIHTAALVQKRLPDPPAVEADFVGLTVPDRFVFGFGMDFQGLWRNAPGLYAVPESDVGH